ncbi:MAG: ABC transporter permease [Acidobacteria bacterium]|nr:ABC transporter permease [Acidobacteriota bacterium]
MARFLARRFLSAFLLLFIVLSLAFFLSRLLPGGPITRSHETSRLTPAQIETLKEAYGLDRPLIEQYLTWLRRILLHWDWGPSFTYRQPAAQVLAQALPNTVILGVTALLLQYFLGTLLGLLTAWRAGGALDSSLRITSLILFSVPSFWLGIMAIYLFHGRLRLLPAGGMASPGAARLPLSERWLDLLQHLVLPATLLGVLGAAAIAQFLRNSLLDVLQQDFIRTARALGIPERRLLWRHALRNALVPLIQLLGLSFPALLNGVLVTEVVFGWPGVGQVLFSACISRDYGLILAATAYGALMVILGSLLSDLLHRAADPRVQLLEHT